jgi:hypothetical protein
VRGAAVRAVLAPGGLHSYRFTEALSCGCIPVVLSDQWVPPFSELVPLQRYGLHVPERDWATVPAMLRALPASSVTALQQQVVEVYEALFVNPVATALHISLGVGTP